ncbi:MAG: hypothetical protein IJQ10_01000 [Clostridia bacterium]|nr:hypothetical protein [Clostridia bacterium]
MDTTRKKFSKYLVELKKAKGKFSFFPDLFAVISKKKNKKKLSDKLTELQNVISDVSQDEESYKESIRNKLNEFSPGEVPKKILEVIEKIQNELDGKADNSDTNLKIGEKVNEKSIDEDSEKEADLSQSLDINRCLKNISKNVKLLKRHTSWFFQKDNSAKIIYNLSLEIIKSIKNNLINKNGKDNEQNIESTKDKNMKSMNIYSDLLAMKDYIAGALKLRMIEKGLHENDKDNLKLLLMSLYEDFSFLSGLLFKKEFEEFTQSFNKLANNDKESAKKYYVKLISKDLKKLPNEGLFSKSDLYKKLNTSFKKLKEYIKSNDDDNIKNNLQNGGNFICQYAENRKKLLEDANIATSRDDTIKIIYNLYNDYKNFIQILGEKLNKELDMDEYFEVDEKTQKQYYQHHFFSKMSSLLQINGLKWFNMYDEIGGDLIDSLKDTAEIKKSLKQKFDEIVEKFNALSDINFIDSSGKVSKTEFIDWLNDFTTIVDKYIAEIQVLKFIDFKENINSFNERILGSLKGVAYKKEDDLLKKLSEFSAKIIAPDNKERFAKYDKEREKILKKNKNGKYFAKVVANVNKILGTIVTVLKTADIGKVIITIEGSSIVDAFVSEKADLGNNYTVFLAAEVSADCALFKTFSSSAIKIRVYFALGYPGLINTIQENFGSEFINAINIGEMKTIESKLNVSNNLSAGSIYFSPYNPNAIKKTSEDIQNTKMDAGKNGKMDAGKARAVLKEIKSEIKYFKPSSLGKIFKSSLTKLIYDPLNKIYESLKIKIKNVSGSESEIEDIIFGGKKFIDKMINDINEYGNTKYKNIHNRSDSDQIIEKLKNLSKNFEDLGESLLSTTNSGKEYANSDNDDDFIKSVGSAKIQGDVLASIPFSSNDMSITVSVENADTKGIIPEHKYKFNPEDLLGSLIACVADLTVKVDLSNLTAFVHKGTKMSISVNLEKAKSDEGGIINYTPLMEFIKKYVPGEYVKFLEGFDSYPKILRDGIRIRAYFTLNAGKKASGIWGKIKKFFGSIRKGIKKSAITSIKISQSTQKGKIKIFR